jgi:hypothetical protein
MWRILKFLFSYMVYSQIWLYILMDDHQFGLSQNWEKKKKKKNIV